MDLNNNNNNNNSNNKERNVISRGLSFKKVEDSLLYLTDKYQCKKYSQISKDDISKKDKLFTDIFFKYDDYSVKNTFVYNNNSSKIFDLASLTKPLISSIILLYEYYQGNLDLKSPIGSYLKNKELYSLLDKKLLDLSFYSIMSHRSGLPSWKNFYTLSINDVESKYDKSFLIERLNFIANHSLEEEKKERYSDVGFILLGLFIEEYFGKRLDLVFKDFLDGIDFYPDKYLGFIDRNNDTTNISKSEFVCSCEFCPLRQKRIQGFVHDENSYFLGGITGHAGGFSDGISLDRYLDKIFFNMEFGKFIFDLLRKDLKQNTDHLYSYGFRKGLCLDNKSYFLSNRSFGHTGFSGGCFWIDDNSKIILLTNRTIFKRSFAMQKLREEFLSSFIVSNK